MYQIGLDLGGTKIEGIVRSPSGETIHRPRVKTPQEEGYGAILDAIADLHRDLQNVIDGRPYTLGIGTPGAISREDGRLKNSNTLCLNGKPFHQDLERRLGRSIRVENDANCFALAEAVEGAGRGYDLVFGVIMGTGCGGGIVHGGVPLIGPQAIAGEWGHMAIDPHGPVCYCGSRGCVETLISGGGLQTIWEKETGESLALAEIMERSRNGDSTASAFVSRFLDHFGRALANLINILDPDAIVLGGGVSNLDELYDEGVGRVRHHIFSDSLETPILRNTLGDSAGVIGAALLGI